MTGIPTELESTEPTFIRLANQSKAPVAGEGSVKGPHFYRDDEDLQSHIQNGGNVGRVLRDDVVAIDVDDGDLIEYLDHLPESLIIKSGGSGFSYHYYYRCSNYEDNQTKLTVEGSDLGSVRSGNAYCAVPPSIHPESQNQYQIYQNQELADLELQDLTELLAEFDRKIDNSQHHGGSGGATSQHGVGSLRGHSEPIPDEYPNQDVDLSRTKSWLKSNGFLGDLNRTVSGDWSGLEFKLAKCLAEGGFSFQSISNTLDRLNHNSKWHNQDENYRKLTVQKAIESAVDDEFVDFSNGDMTSSQNEVESHKTEKSGSKVPDKKGGENNMPTFENKESVQVKSGESDGDRAIEATRVEGQDGSDEFEFISIRKGRVQEVELTSGDSGLMIDIDQTSSKSVGGTQDLNLVIEALEELQDEIN